MNMLPKILRLLAPICERQRMEFRHSLHMAEAHAEDLTRTLLNLDAAKIKQAMEAHKEGR